MESIPTVLLSIAMILMAFSNINQSSKIDSLKSTIYANETKIKHLQTDLTQIHSSIYSNMKIMP